MLHPFIENRNYLKSYAIIWLIIAIVQGVLLVYKFDFDLEIAIIDTVTYNFMFAIMGASIWFVGAYADYENQSTQSIILKQIISGIFLVVIWVYSSNWIITKIIVDAEYLNSDFTFWRYILGGFYYVIISIVFYLILYIENIKYELEQKNKYEKNAINAELKALKSQVNPHFLFNSLNSISYLTISDGFKAQEMLVRLSDYIRYSLRKEGNQFTTLKEELENLHSYLDIEKIRFEDKIKYSEDIEKGLENLKVPHLILQPLMENAIKYGVYESDIEVPITLKILLKDDYLKITMENYFETSSFIHKGEGIGLSNISERLKLLYNSVDLLKTKSEKNIFTATILIPTKSVES